MGGLPGRCMAGKQKKRRWPDEEKRSICFQTMAPGVSVAQVARRYAMNANLIFKWLKDERYAPDADAEFDENWILNRWFHFETAAHWKFAI